MTPANHNARRPMSNPMVGAREGGLSRPVEREEVAGESDLPYQRIPLCVALEKL